MRGHKRRKLLVDAFQHRILVLNLAYFCATVLVFSVVVFGPAIWVLRSNSAGWQQQQDAATQFLSLHARLWPALAVLFALFALHSLILSHRIAGPLYRFRRLFKSIGEGDLSVRASIRKRDYLAKEAGSINQMIEGLRARVTGIGESAESLRMGMAELRKTTGNGPASACVERLESELVRLKAQIGEFKIEWGGSSGSGASSQDVPVQETPTPESGEPHSHPARR